MTEMIISTDSRFALTGWVEGTDVAVVPVAREGIVLEAVFMAFLKTFRADDEAAININSSSAMLWRELVGVLVVVSVTKEMVVVTSFFTDVATLLPIDGATASCLGISPTCANHFTQNAIVNPILTRWSIR